MSFFDTGCPGSYTALRPTLIVLCFDVRSRESLESIHTRWKHEVETHFNYDEQLPVMLLGLKRDQVTDRPGEAFQHDNQIMPQEALNIAQEMRLDLYAECSSTTGHTLLQACDDVMRMAFRSLRDDGGRSQAPSCSMM